MGKRKDKHPIILEVNTEKAREEGVKFYLGNEKVWLADEIPSEFIAINKN
ncbi:RNA 2'-phosphotransferase [Bacillus wiedmannii]|nr:RNA 2'-phosphotransferase [Bacillus wiedmannii]MED3126448.1 RNA 2'-phosphotransferase [Bacillus wiedmannii]